MYDLSLLLLMSQMPGTQSGTLQVFNKQFIEQLNSGSWQCCSLWDGKASPVLFFPFPWQTPLFVSVQVSDSARNLFLFSQPSLDPCFILPRPLIMPFCNVTQSFTPQVVFECLQRPSTRSRPWECSSEHNRPSELL